MADRQGSLFSKLDISLSGTAVAASVWTFPVIVPGLLWMQLFSPLPVFYYLYDSGYAKGINTLAAALVLTGAVAAITGTAAALVFTFILLPTGYSMARSAFMGNSPVKTGMKGLAALLVGWLIWSVIHGVTHQVGLYQEILTTVDGSVAAAGQAIIASSELSAEHVAQLQTTFDQLRKLLPGIMPGLLFITMLNSIFCNLLLGQWLLHRFSRTNLPWPPFREWRLPEQMVVTVIAAGITFLLPVEFFKVLGLNLLFAAGTLYLFQGIAVLGTLLHKWSVPTALKVLVYLLILVQAYGVIMLAFLGVADIWVDFGKEKPISPEENDK
ncbi:MAG: YybS family protein [Proteobacteria bacterium]|nr:YybS family protein [Pseudomonadota bacterium]MBU1738687.1 YybS family protein [Pseudomonadota bacterium]